LVSGPEWSSAMLDKMVFNSWKKRIDPYLEPGEELLSVTTPLEAEGSPCREGRCGDEGRQS